MDIRPALPGDLPLAKTWLQSAGLPTADLKDVHMQNFLIASAGDAPVGMIGVEEYANCGLLRSLIVDESCRGSGVGERLIAALEERTARHGLQSLWLLTIDADAYFSRLGYAEMPRHEAPQAIQDSAEFSSLCPGDAVLMCKRLTSA